MSAPSASSPVVINVTMTTFQHDVMQRSLEGLVILDFWAPWCQPCQQLAPVLEKLAAEYAGKFTLAKVNTDEEPNIAQAFGIQSLPTVIAFANGQPVDQFQGMLTEEQIRQWLAPLLPSPAQILAMEAAALVETDPQAAESKYREALALMPDQDALKICLASVLLKQGRLDECGSIIEGLEQRGFLEPDAERIKSELEVRVASAESGGVEEARKAAEADPKNLVLQVRVAEALAASSQHRKALELCLEIVQQDFGDARNAAKETMVNIFSILGPASELTSEFRRKLSTALY
jgi:putative thioredoxin